MSDDKKSGSSGPNTRWWESYLVRYFSGAVVGAICLSAILLYLDFRLYGGEHTTKPLDDKALPAAAIAFLLIAGGLMYSYIISAPITVIHFGRYWRSKMEQHVRYFWLGWVITLIGLNILMASGVLSAAPDLLCAWVGLAIIAVSYLVCSSLGVGPRRPQNARPKSRRAQRREESQLDAKRSIGWAILLTAIVMVATKLLGLQGRPAVVALLAFSLPTVFVGCMQYVTLFRIFRTERCVHRFYRVLTRARRLEGSKDIRETYTHLREHSNATFIVLLELCFSAFIVFCIEAYVGRGQNISGAAPSRIMGEGLVLTVLMLTAMWMTPNLFMWSRANQLERDFSKRPRLYAGKQPANGKDDSGSGEEGATPKRAEGAPA